MAEINDWNVAAANNNTASPDGFPEGMAPSGLNNSAREVMAVIARDLEVRSGNVTSTGTSSAYAVAYTQIIAATPYQGAFSFTAHIDNIEGAVTLSVNGGTALPLIVPGVAGNIVPIKTIRVGGVYTAYYTGTNFILANARPLQPTAINPITKRYQYFRSGAAGTQVTLWTKPANLDYIDVLVVPPGGGGGIGVGASGLGGSGATGDVVRGKILAADLPATVNVGVGERGFGGISFPVTIPTAGTNSYFEFLITCPGGGAPLGNGAGVNNVGGLTVASAINGVVTNKLVVPGTNGNSGGTQSATNGHGVPGISSIFGGANRMYLQNTNVAIGSNSANAQGASGGGGFASVHGPAESRGGDGGDGYVEITEYYVAAPVT